MGQDAGVSTNEPTVADVDRPSSAYAPPSFGTVDARQAAEAVYFERPFDGLVPADDESADLAIGRLAELLKDLPPKIRAGLVGAGESAAQLSSDRFQGLAEIIQNADDLGATEVQFRLQSRSDGNELIATHNGRPVTLPDVMGLAIPWLSLKTDDSRATGRFGIGLMTLRALSDELYVHCGHMHFRLEALTITPQASRRPPSDMGDGTSTMLAVPLAAGAVDVEQLTKWFNDWDHGSLLFLSHVASVTLSDGDGTELVRLELRRSPARHVEGAGVTVEVVSASDHRVWAVYRFELEVPVEQHRFRKAQDRTTPLAIAFCRQGSDRGWVHAGLPLRPLPVPFRMSAQFDPLANRRDLADLRWNAMLLEALGRLWASAALEEFKTTCGFAWLIVPDPSASAEPAWLGGQLGEALTDSLLETGLKTLGEHLSFRVDDMELRLQDLAVEAPELTEILSPQEVADLAQVRATLPASMRDADGRWRTVLTFIEGVGGPSPTLVGVSEALPLIEDDGRKPSFVIGLAAAAVSAGLGEELSTYRCVLGEDGVLTVPPLAASPDALVEGDVDPVFDALSLGRRLHPEYFEGPTGEVVREWLLSEGSLLISPTVDRLMARLAEAGAAGNAMSTALADDQLLALRDAFEQLSPVDRDDLGPNIGSAILLAAVTYDHRGKLTRTSARPVDAYIIEKEADSWYVAAYRTPGLVWLDRRHSETLRRVRGAPRMGAQRLFRLLGAASGPRLVPHPQGIPRYKHGALGVPLSVGTSARMRALTRRNARFTIHDHISPDLQAAVESIARDRDPPRRRKRANALVAALTAGWAAYGDRTTAQAVMDDNGWVQRGSVPASWLFNAGGVAWLPNGGGGLRTPQDLRLRTPANVAHFGPEKKLYVSSELVSPLRVPVLNALGVIGDPPASQLIAWLQDLRSAAPNGSPQCLEASTLGRASAIYEALAGLAAQGSSRSVGDLSIGRFREHFSQGDGLVLTNVGWRRPSTVFTGMPVFGDRRPFAPTDAATDRLWRLLSMRAPTAREAREVLAEIARAAEEPDDKTLLIMLETWQFLSRVWTKEQATTIRLNRLQLWTSKGWAKRPVYAPLDPDISQALGEIFPVWQPGGAVEQFKNLLRPLGVTVVSRDFLQVRAPSDAVIDEETTELFSAAVKHLQSDLARDDPEAEASLSIAWDELAAFSVAVAPDLCVVVTGLDGGTRPALETPAFADAQSQTLYVRDTGLAGRVRGGGRAVATLSSVESRRIAYAWRAAWDNAEDSRDVELLQVARAREAERSEAAAAAKADLSSFAKGVGDAHRKKASTRSDEKPPEPKDRTDRQTPPRNLIDLYDYDVSNPEGKQDPGKQSEPSPSKTRKPLKNPDLSTPTKRPGKSGRGPTNYTPEEKEAMGLQLVIQALASDQQDIKDIRDQRGVGADAVDGLRRYFELKVHSGPLPDEVFLTENEVRRALEDNQFFLALVGNVEEGRGDPEVRFIIDPLRTVRMKSSGGVRLGPLAEAPSVSYTFRRRNPKS